MKNRLIFFILLVMAIGASSGCYHDNLQEMTPGAGLSNMSCDTTGTMTYSYHIAPIMAASCGTATCHGSSNPYVNLSAYVGVKKNVVNGQFWNCINGTGGISPMPKNGTPLSSCNLKKIKKWIDDGAPNN